MIQSDNTFVQLANLGETVELSPALTAFGDRLVFAWFGEDNRIRVMTTDLQGGSPWPITVLEDTTIAPPSLAVFKGSVVLAYAGENYRHYTLVSMDGLNFPAADRTSQDPPSPTG